MHHSIEDFVSSLFSGDTFYFKWKIDTSYCHYQVILNSEIIPDTKILFLWISTTKLEKNKTHLEKNALPDSTLVEVSVWEVNFLKKHSCFNCNYLKQYERDYLFWEYLQEELVYEGRMPPKILEKLLKWVQDSPLIDKRTKKIIFWED